MKNLSSLVEAILFLKGEPMSASQLAKITERTEPEIGDAIDFLSQDLNGRGVRLIKKENKFMLATAPEFAGTLERLIKEEFDSEISKAASEVISIVLYKGPVARAEIDYIRGVNSSFTVRNLIIRDLIEKIPNPRDSRSFVYKPSVKLLQYLGVKDIKELPDYENFNEKMAMFLDELTNEENNKENEE